MNNSEERKDNNLPSIQLSLNGEPIYLMEFQSTVKVIRQDEEMSGQENSTARADKGIKAKELHVRGLIPFAREQWLTRLFQLAEASNSKGEQVTYRIANFSAGAVNMREGVFSGEITAEEQAVQGWIVNFVLVEQHSVAEKKAKKTQKPAAKKQTEKTKTKTKASKAKKSTKAKKSAKTKGSSGDSGFTVYLD